MAKKPAVKKTVAKKAAPKKAAAKKAAPKKSSPKDGEGKKALMKTIKKALDNSQVNHKGNMIPYHVYVNLTSKK